MKILIADDSKTNLAIITNSLESLGHIVMPVTSGEQAIEVFQQISPDLVILDVVMNGMNGFECAKQLRALIHVDHWIPIIFLSANVDDDSIKQGIDSGGDDYLTKPFSDITLAAKIKAMQRIADMRAKLVETSHKLALLSSTDALTGVYNRFQFDKSIIEKTYAAERYKHLMGLLYIDLDNFKLINDTFGHNIGDMLLKEVVNRIKSCLRTDDFLARVGGDEFAIVLSEIASIEAMGLVAQKIIDSLLPDFYFEGHHVRSSVSIGIACYPYPGTTKDNIVKHADIAMYHAKSLGRNNFQYFSDALNKKYKQHIDLEYALKFALERKELSLYYQPIYDIIQNRVSGLEVLLNWNHPKYGTIAPSIFVPIAEETGLITTIGNWVIRTACEQAQKWSLDKFKDFKLAINLSSQQLSEKDFFQLIIDSLRNNKLQPNILELEITESTVMNYRADMFKNAIQNLHHVGISIAIDDFGTGYSSLTRLKNLAIDTLKIDKVFIQDIMTDANSAIIINCLIALGQNLGVKIIAEGIETTDQLLFLKEKGCRYGQGFLLSRPLTADKIPAFLERQEQLE